MARDDLSKRQLAIYQFICNYAQERGYPPSVREIGSAVGLASPSTVHMHLKVLEERGYIRRDSRKPRTIEVVEETIEDTASVSDDGLMSPARNYVNDTLSLPLVGSVAAGTPVLAEQNVEEVISVPATIAGEDSAFLLRVRGQSMINAGIYDGDYIVVKEQADAHDGEIIVALLDDSATVKTFYREKDMVRLQPENDTMEPIYVKNPTILGRVTALMRSIS